MAGEVVPFGLFVVPGSVGNTDVSFSWTHRDAGYNNELGFYVVDDLNGGIVSDPSNPQLLLPSNPSYRSTALAPDNATVLFARGEVPNGRTASAPLENYAYTKSLSLPAGTIISFYVVQNGVTAAAASSTSTNVWFPLVAANRDLLPHFRLVQPGTTAAGKPLYFQAGHPIRWKTLVRHYRIPRGIVLTTTSTISSSQLLRMPWWQTWRRCCSFPRAS